MTMADQFKLRPASRRPAWQKPALTELRINSQTKTHADDADSQLAEPPPPPAPTMDKLGFSFEWAFPMSTKVTS